MSNVFFPSGKISTKSRAKYKIIRNYDKSGKPQKDYKFDLDFEKCTFSKACLKKVISSVDLKLVDYKLILYIAYTLSRDQDTITLKPEKLEPLLQRKRSTISSSIKRVSMTGIIEKIPGRCKYQINPRMIFKGNRIEYLESIDPKLTRMVGFI